MPPAPLPALHREDRHSVPFRVRAKQRVAFASRSGRVRLPACSVILAASSEFSEYTAMTSAILLRRFRYGRCICLVEADVSLQEELLGPESLSDPAAAPRLAVALSPLGAAMRMSVSRSRMN